MEILMDDSRADRQFREILGRVRLGANRIVAEKMEQRGLHYLHNWGVTVPELNRLAADYEPSHLLAFKLWNKRWRETMILATWLDHPGLVTEEQMDYWTRSLENQEIAGLLSANLWSRTPYAFVKSLEWCRGKKHLTRYTGVHLLGKMASVDKRSPDEMFSLFFDPLRTLSRDPALETILAATLIALSNRSAGLFDQVTSFITSLNNPRLAASSGV